VPDLCRRSRLAPIPDLGRLITVEGAALLHRRRPPGFFPRRCGQVQSMARKPKVDRRSPDAIREAGARRGRELREADPSLDAREVSAGDTVRRELLVNAGYREARPENDPFYAHYLEIMRKPLPAARIWSIPEYTRLMREKFIPLYNRRGGAWRLCVECGTQFGVRDGRGDKGRFCSEECGRRVGKRGRSRKNDGRSAEERAALKFGMRAQKHMHSCKRCMTGTTCPVGEKFLAASSIAATDALNRARGDLPPDL
jgi:hypothetical protein